MANNKCVNCSKLFHICHFRSYFMFNNNNIFMRFHQPKIKFASNTLSVKGDTLPYMNVMDEQLPNSVMSCLRLRLCVGYRW